MRLCRFDGDRIGLVRGALVHDVSAVLANLPGLRWPVPPGDLLIAHLDRLRPAMEKLADTTKGRPVADVRLDSPVANPTKIIAAAANFPEHLVTLKAQPGELGTLIKVPSCLVGPAAGVALRFLDRTNVHETELAVVIGAGGSDIPVDRALHHVAGYAIGLDITLRGREFPSICKSIDTYGVLGPWMVTPDEIGDVSALDFSLKVNGEPRQADNTSRLVFGVPRMIAFASTYMTLYPGDVIMMGNPPGAAPLKPGDVMEATIDRIGSMTVAVRAHG